MKRFYTNILPFAIVFFASSAKVNIDKAFPFPTGTKNTHKEYMLKNILQPTLRQNFNYGFQLSPLTKTALTSVPFIMAGVQAANQENNFDVGRETLLCSALFIPTVITGFVIKDQGKPYNTLLFTTHKMGSLSNLYILNKTLLNKNKEIGLGKEEVLTSIVMNTLFATTIVTGGLLSVDKDMPDFMNAIHHTSLWLTMVSSGILLYLLGN